MASSENESELSSVLSQPTVPRSVTSSASSAIAKHTRNRATRRPVLSTKPSVKPSPLRQSSQTILSFARVSASQDVEGQQQDSDNEIERAALSDSEVDSYHVSQPSENSQMSSHRPESSVSETISNPTGHLSIKRARTKTSAVHHHAEVKLIANKGDCYVCNLCSKAFEIGGGTGGISRHLKKIHHIDPSASSVAQKRKREGNTIDAVILRGAEINIQAEEKRRQILMGTGLNKATLEFLYIRWIITQGLSLNQVNHSAFRSFLEYCNPAANQMLPRAPSTIKIHVQQLFLEGKERLRHILATAISDIHITCDMWTSPNNLGMLAIVAHFTSDKLSLPTVTLGLKEIQGDHSGFNQGGMVIDVLKDFGFLGKLGYFVMDNASSNDKLIATVLDVLLEEGVIYDIDQRRLRCNGHVINLAVQAFLFGQTVDDYEYPEHLNTTSTDAQLAKWRKMGPLGKLHNIVIWIMGSTQRIQAFKKRSGGIMPHRDNKTRWNSWYNMLDWAIKRIKPSIIAVSNKEADLAQDVLTADEWKTLGHIRDFLQSFHDATKATEGRSVGLDEVLPTMDFLAERFEKAIDNFGAHIFMFESLQAGYTKLLKYWNKTERSPAYIAAIVLDPTVKWSYFDDWDPEWQPEMKPTLRTFWETSYRSSTSLISDVPLALEEADTSNEYLNWRTKKRSANTNTGDELERYLNEPLISSSSGQSALKWWLEQTQRIRFPLLSKMAIDIYSIPAMSSEPERVFSGTKHTITDIRGSLKSETIETLECLKSWFRLDIFTEEDLHAIVNAVEQDDSLLDRDD